ILYKILNEEKVTIEVLSNEMILSKNTIVQTFEYLKNDLRNMGLTLVYKRGYKIVGDETKIRDIYILLMEEDRELLKDYNKKILDFDSKCFLKLTDYSLTNLSKFAEFINRRIKNGYTINSYKFKSDVKGFEYYNLTKTLLSEDANEEEISYLCAYISTLPSLNNNVSEDIIEKYVDKLIRRFEVNTAIQLENKNVFKKNIKRHLLSSYYRIRFRFPISNPSLEEIKRKHDSLYKIIKSILEDKNDFPDFIGIREEEIGFIAAYFGGYLRGTETEVDIRKKVLVVCPNGLLISKNIEIQLYKYIPAIDIIGVMSIKDMQCSDIDYDYIVSTVEIPNKENVIVVNPMLTKLDIKLLMDKLVTFNQSNLQFNIELIMQAIKRNANIINYDNLKNDLIKIIYQMDEKEAYQPMLKELINEQRVRKVSKVKDWEEAIKVAARPLLEDGSIKEEYVEAMIESIKKHGPYIVLADRFALPHASAKEGVNRLSMSLLTVEEEVDLLGKPVNIFMVLATVDNNSHIKALASLSELLYDEENLKIFRDGDSKKILKIINDQN
ncbi:PTS sugar transporter subunit IIA, partial [Clostridium tertium]